MVLEGRAKANPSSHSTLMPSMVMISFGILKLSILLNFFDQFGNFPFSCRNLCCNSGVLTSIRQARFFSGSFASAKASQNFNHAGTGIDSVIKSGPTIMEEKYVRSFHRRKSALTSFIFALIKECPVRDITALPPLDSTNGLMFLCT